MKPDAVNVGVPKHSVGDIAAWTHDIHFKYEFLYSEVLIKEVKYIDEDNWYYELVSLQSGSEFSCSERNLRTIEEAKEAHDKWLKF
jgi:uncharacterized protein YpmB